MNTFTGDLPDTRTYRDRRWAFIGRTEPAADGVLLIQQYRGSRAEVDRYRIEEQPAIGAMGRAFLVARQTGAAEVYQTIIGPVCWCDCKAAKTHSPNCKHRDSIAAMIADGVL